VKLGALESVKLEVLYTTGKDFEKKQIRTTAIGQKTESMVSVGQLGP